MKKEYLDPWQKQILKTKGNILLISGRQIGKSELIAIDAAEFASHHSKKSILIISHSERQAYWLFEKVMAYLIDNYKSMIKRGKDKPTKKMCRLTNGTIIHCLPTGLTGSTIRGLTVHRLYPDEAHYIPEEVWNAVTPMLLTTGGVIRASTTPRGAEGYLYDKMYLNPKFKKFHKNSEDVIKKRKFSPIWTKKHRENALEHIKDARETMTKLKFAQEYMGEFVSDIKQFFPDELIKQAMENKISYSAGDAYIGVDVGGPGGDLSTFEGGIRADDKLIQTIHETMEFTLTTDVSNHLISLDREKNFVKIFVDDGGLGFGVFSELLSNEQTKRKAIPINNASRPLDKDGRRKKKILKEDLYNNLKVLMEKNKIQLIDSDEIFFSLKSVQKEFSKETGNLIIHGRDTHIAEGLIRFAWAVKEKNIKLWFNYR